MAAFGVIALAILGAYSAYQQGQYQAATARVQKKQSELQAKQLQVEVEAERTEAEKSELERQRQLAQVLATQSAAFAASGLDVTSGSFQAIQTADIKKAAARTREGRVFSGVRQAGFRTNIAQARASAKQFGFAARSANRQSLISASMSGVSSYNSRRR